MYSIGEPTEYAFADTQSVPNYRSACTDTSISPILSILPLR
jgi:hypothetical protein